MKSNISIVIYMLAASILLRLIVFANKWQFTSYENIYFLGNTLILMTGVFFGIRLLKSKSKEKTTFLADVKGGMKVVALYAIFMSIFAYCYYSYIDSAYFPTKMAAQMEIAVNNGYSAADLKMAEENMNIFLTPYMQSTVTLILYILLGSFYAAMLTFFVRKARMEA